MTHRVEHSQPLEEERHASDRIEEAGEDDRGQQDEEHRHDRLLLGARDGRDAEPDRDSSHDVEERGR